MMYLADAFQDLDDTVFGDIEKGERMSHIGHRVLIGTDIGSGDEGKTRFIFDHLDLEIVEVLEELAEVLGIDKEWIPADNEKGLSTSKLAEIHEILKKYSKNKDEQRIVH